MKNRFRFFSLIALLALVVAACSSETDSTTTTQAEESASTTEAPAETNTIVDIVVGNEDFSTLLAAVQAADLTDALADPDATLTVFAPTNAAFEAAIEALGTTAEDLLADTETLTAILTYHVLGDVVTSTDLANAGTEEISVTTLSDQELIVVVGDDGSVGFADQTATVTQADIEADNGVIHVIDAVLLPPSN